jgi:N-acetylglucosaminyldiphosphoundecaprenol N-acetyl-beta-D-mannosaminyltransferase
VRAERTATNPGTPVPSARRALPEVGLLGTGIHALSESECVELLLGDLDRGRGGWLVCSDLQHLMLARQDAAFREIYEAADVRIPEGKLLTWACRLQRTPLPERVAMFGFALHLCTEAARRQRSVFLISENEACAARAADALRARVSGLAVVGSDAAPTSVDGDPVGVARVSRKIDAAKPDLVLVGLDTPQQERLMHYLRHDRPEAWFLGVGDALRLLASELRPAPAWMERIGVAWVHRMLQEPSKLFGPYVLEAFPAGALLLVRSAVRGTIPKGKSEGRWGRRPRTLLVDDDPFALEHLELLLSSRFPQLAIEKRTTPDVSGAFDFYFLDNDFEGHKLASELARSVRADRPRATIVAFSGVLDVDTLKSLINVGCDGVCDKEDPASWRPILELVDRRLGALAAKHKGSTFGGVRNAAFSIQRLLADWNRRGGTAREPAVARPAEPREEQA